MKSIVLSVLKDKYLKKKQNGLDYDAERFHNMYGDFVPKKKDLISYVLKNKKFAELINNIHEVHKEGKGIVFSGNDVEKTEDTSLFFQTELCCWGYAQFRTSFNNILELKYGNGRKQEDSTEQKQWERINHKEFLIIDLWEDDFDDKKRLVSIVRLIRERLRKTLATVLVVNFPLENLIGMASDDFYSLIMEENKFIIFNSVKEQIKR